MQSIALQRLAGTLGLDINQLRFVFCQLFAIAMGFCLRKFIPPGEHNSKKRHLYEAVVGVFVLYVCYGSYIIHLLAQALPAYLMLVFLPLSIAQYGILIFSMVYLSAVHIHQLLEHSYCSVDISAPLMVQTQKLSSLAFNINDGRKLEAGEEVARPCHGLHAIKRRPRFLQLSGYLCCFHSCMIGPFIFFADYLKFIEGTESQRLSDPKEQQKFEENKDAIRAAKNEMRKQIQLTILHTILAIWALKYFKAEFFLSDAFGAKNIFQKYIWMTVACFAFRQRFYFAWTISCVANLAAGFGFSGFDKNGQPEYRIATNIHFLAIELGTNTKSIFDAWNTGTTSWLRECIYDRVPAKYAVWTVFAVSAMWHGFEPGFYLAFISAALLTVAGRICRKHLRPYFLISTRRHRFYDILTSLSAMFCLNYLGVAFLLRKTNTVLFFWRRMNFLGHIFPLIFIICLPLLTATPPSQIHLNTPEQTPLEDLDKEEKQKSQ